MYRRDIIPDIEEKHADIFEGGSFKLVAVNQEDGDVTHRDAVYHMYILEEFRWRDWILFNQPPKSPVTNVKETHIFPMWSNNVSNNQTNSFGIQLLTGEYLYEIVNNIFWYKKCLPAF